MSLFGTNYPKFVGTGDPDSATVDLLGGQLAEANWVVPDVIEQTAPISGFRRWLSDGDYSEFSVLVKLYDTGSYANAAARSAKVTEVAAYEHKYVNFYPYSTDGTYVRDSANAAVRFFVESIRYGFHSSNEHYDIMTIKLKSEDYTDPTKSLI